jgi:uncharacterized membrane protein
MGEFFFVLVWALFLRISKGKKIVLVLLAKGLGLSRRRPGPIRVCMK